MSSRALIALIVTFIASGPATPALASESMQAEEVRRLISQGSVDAAREKLLSCADAQVAECQHMLGQWVEVGELVSQDFGTARKLYELAYRGGYEPAGTDVLRLAREAPLNEDDLKPPSTTSVAATRPVVDKTATSDRESFPPGFLRNEDRPTDGFSSPDHWMSRRVETSRAASVPRTSNTAHRAYEETWPACTSTARASGNGSAIDCGVQVTVMPHNIDRNTVLTAEIHVRNATSQRQYISRLKIEGTQGGPRLVALSPLKRGNGPLWSLIGATLANVAIRDVLDTPIGIPDSANELIRSQAAGLAASGIDTAEEEAAQKLSQPQVIEGYLDEVYLLPGQSFTGLFRLQLENEVDQVKVNIDVNDRTAQMWMDVTKL